ncbi:MAG TPA: hypothetical protein VJ911_05545 [Cryomorphaceae bacterium]|nr:hypothetical protein [Cryomorphaceae bacterium]
MTRSYSLIAVIFILLNFGWSCSSQKQALEGTTTMSAKTHELAERIKRDNIVSSEHIGRDSQPSPAFQNAEKLKAVASIEELRLLTDDENAALSAIAFEGLFEKDYNGIDEVLVKYVERDDEVQVISGDLFREIPLLEYAFENVMGYDVENPIQKPEPSKQISPELEQMIRAKLYSGPSNH